MVVEPNDVGVRRRYGAEHLQHLRLALKAVQRVGVHALLAEHFHDDPKPLRIVVVRLEDPALAADGQRIQYGAVRAIANPLSNLFAGNSLGSANGPGFGWRDITVSPPVL